MRRYRNVYYNGPDYYTEARLIIRGYLPRAGEIIERRARGKLGIYQPGWARLAASTLRKKRGSMRRMGRRTPFERTGGADAPLIDTGKMARSIKSFARGWSSANVVANFPAGQHEQDLQVGAFRIPALIPLPKRPFMWPAVIESEQTIVDELTDRLAAGL